VHTSTSCFLNARWHEPVFSVAGSEYTWVDVFLAAMLRDDWRAFERTVRDGLRLESEAGEIQSWPDEEQISEAATAFRYEHNLLTAAELTRWLGDSGVTLDDWTAFFSRQLLRRASVEGGVREDSFETALVVPDEVFAAEGICSGEFERLAETLAGHAAAATQLAEAPELPSATLDAQVARVMAAYDPWLKGGDSAAIASRLRALAAMQARFEIAAAAATTERALAIEVGRHLIDWTRVDLERLSFSDADAAREAALCIREDGLSMSDVAFETRQMVRDTRDLLERIEPELRDLVLSADLESLVGPVVVGDRHELAWMIGRAPGTLADPLVRGRAEQAVVDRLVSKAILTHVRWL
jgi:hypothetical protein